MAKNLHGILSYKVANVISLQRISKSISALTESPQVHHNAVIVHIGLRSRRQV
jgi:hypothetical protein